MCSGVRLGSANHMWCLQQNWVELFFFKIYQVMCPLLQNNSTIHTHRFSKIHYVCHLSHALILTWKKCHIYQLSFLQVGKRCNAVTALRGLPSITNLTVLCRDQSLDFSVNICVAKSLHQMQWSSCHSYAASVSCIQLALTSERRQWCYATAHSQTTNSCHNVEYFPWFTCN